MEGVGLGDWHSEVVQRGEGLRLHLPGGWCRRVRALLGHRGQRLPQPRGGPAGRVRGDHRSQGRPGPERAGDRLTPAAPQSSPDRPVSGRAVVAWSSRRRRDPGNVGPVGRSQGGGFEGEALVVWARVGGRPVFLAALHHTASPYGPFVELVTGEFRSRPGLRPRLRQTTLAVSGGPAREAGAEAAGLTWWASEPFREVHWEERGFRVRAEAKRVAVPAIVPSDLLHPGWAGDAEPARRLPAKVHLARLEVEVPAADEQ